MSTQMHRNAAKLNVLALVLSVAFAPFALADIEIHPEGLSVTQDLEINRDGPSVTQDIDIHRAVVWVRNWLRTVWSTVKNH